ncbi:Thiamine biosynthesis protein (ThiI) [Desulfuromusa kysingii]|uniref:Thiamine biosynthesis protein (ThiI) n=1 Tax=Desulfuromusa kysingii TaxID=37625 RepID=A0A1H4CMR6_9BACT|nr:thiamine biosynthesis protein [Desulfuromusa kysingii]SEA61745.1 Thiamine biosynthesis protein (ThiI) [Desulfuromusa kysingii]
MSKALGLISGGLDSSLAAMTLMRQGIEVTGISFVTPFFNADKARASAEAIGYNLILEDISDIHLKMVKKPKYGYGRNMNPCIDCHALMFQLAGERMLAGGFDFLFSGEVLGQRPMSQNANALKSVAKHSGFAEQVLRPLSAKLLPITAMEESGLVDRTQLLDIQGRSRKPQQALAKEWGLLDYPGSGGGCLLTEAGFSNQLRDLFEHDQEATVADVELLKVGRQFRLSTTAKLILGRHQADNAALQKQARPEQIKLRCQNFSGPLGLYCGNFNQVELETAAAIVASYGKGKEATEVDVLCITSSDEFVCKVKPMSRDLSRDMLIR